MNEYKIENAWRYYHQGLHDMAIDTLKEVLADEPDNVFAHGLLAANLLAKGRLHASEYELKIALNIDPYNSFLYLVFARINIFKKKPDKALEYCDQVLSIDTDSPEAHLLKSEILMLLGKRQDALLSIQAAANLAPDSPRIVIAFGEYYLAIGDLHAAHKYALEALAMNAQDEDGNLLMGKVMLAKGDIEEAEYHAKFVIIHNPNSRDALTLLGNIKMGKNLFLGLWWRFNSKLSTLTQIKGCLALIVAYLIFNLFSLVVKDLGYPIASFWVSISWLAIVAYSWIGIPFYQKAMKKELESFSFNQKF